MPRGAADRRRIEVFEMCRQPRNHGGGQHMGNVGHNRVGAPSFDKGAQLVLEVLRLLARQSRHREIATVALRLEPVAGLAIEQLRIKASRCGDHPLASAGGNDAHHRERDPQQSQPQINSAKPHTAVGEEAAHHQPGPQTWKLTPTFATWTFCLTSTRPEKPLMPSIIVTLPWPNW